MPDGTVLKMNETIIEENLGNGNALFIHKTSIQHGDVSEEEETVNVGPSVNNSNNSNNNTNNKEEIGSNNNNNTDKNEGTTKTTETEKSPADKI
jgi:hypothetical protein